MPGMSGNIQSEHLNRYYFVINQIDLTNLTVVDLASGEGYGSDLLSNFSKNVFGIDISNEAVDYASKKYKKNNLEFIVGSAFDIPLKSNSVDVFISFETIEHHDKHEEMLCEIKRVLKPNGILIISSPDKHFYSDERNYINKFHVKELYYEDFKKLINKHFHKATFYLQNIIVGSMITLDEKNQIIPSTLVCNAMGEVKPFSPLYNLAIATNLEDFSPLNQQIIFNESNLIITHYQVDNIINSYVNSIEYRLGKKIVLPLRFIKKMMVNSLNSLLAMFLKKEK